MQDFNVYIIPVTMALDRYNEVHIVQGDIEAMITNETLALETNGNRSTVYYDVTEAPEYGELMIDYLSVTSFSQVDVDSGQLFYFQSDMSSGFDQFRLDVRDSAHNEISGVLLAVIVEPRIHIQDDVIPVTSDGPFQITVDVLDAGELASLTGSDPVYHVFILPRLGTLSVTTDTQQRQRRRRDDSPTWQRIRRKRRNGNDEDELESESVDTKLKFSHDDVVNNRVMYTPSPNAAPENGDNGPQQDGFNYTLMAPNTQPAVGSLKFEVRLPPATEAAPMKVDGDDDYNYVYVDDVEDSGESGSEYVTTALIVAGGALTSICSIISYRCYRLSRRRRWKRRQRELEALRQDDKPEPVERHAADLHPSEPLLTRSTWIEPMHVAASETELRQIRAEHWLTNRQSRSRLNDALRCTGVDSAADDQQQAPPDHSDRVQTLPLDSAFPDSQASPSAQSTYSSNRKDDFPPRSVWFDSFSGTQPGRSTRDDPTEAQTLDRQRRPPTLSRLTEPLPVTSPNDSTTCQSDTRPTRTDTLLSWLDKPDAASSCDDPPRSTQPPSTAHSYPAHDRLASQPTDGLSRPTTARLPVVYPGGQQDTADTERYPNDRQTSAVDRSGTQQQHPHHDSDHPTPEHSSVPWPVSSPGRSDALRSTLPRFTLQHSVPDRGASESDGLANVQTQERGGDPCTDGSHCSLVQRDDVISGATSTTIPDISESPGTLPGDDDGGYVTGSRPQRQLDDTDNSSARHVEAGPAAAAQQVVYDWDKVDPQLLDLCRKTSPILDKNQYWV